MFHTLKNKIGFTTSKIDNEKQDIYNDKDFMDIYNLCKPYTMTSIERMYAVYNSINYIIKNGIIGDFIECGVWKGGSSMMIAYTLLQNNINNRILYLYDTYEGMSEPTSDDFAIDGNNAKHMLNIIKKQDANAAWCYAGIDEVKNNINSTGYPLENVRFVKGKVEETLPNNVIQNIALLRLDTDWYESTKIEMELLYPKLQEKGVLIIDDFGHWEGAKKAVLEYFKNNNINLLINRIDYTGRIIIK